MLKKFKLGTMGMASMIILMFIVATLNVGTASTVADSISDQKSTDKKTSDLKWVKKHVKGIGDVTAREDMFVGEGDNISIVLNKDYKDIGAITPIIENATEPDTVTVDTPYGKVVTSRDNYNKLGKEKIIADQKAFIEERNQLIKNGMLNTSAHSHNIFQAMPQAQTSSILKPKAMSTSAVTSEVKIREDYRFGVIPGYYPEGIYGEICPCATSPLPPSTTWSYHELEIHLSDDDVCEFISQHHSAGKKVWAALFIGTYMEWLPELDFDNINNQIEFYFKTNSATNTYDIRLYNPVTEVTHSTNIGVSPRETFIEHLSASTELTYQSPISAFYAYSYVTQWSVDQGSSWYYAPSVFYPQLKIGSNQYVDVAYSLQGNYHDTKHASGNTVS